MTVLILRDKLNDMESISLEKSENSVFGIDALTPQASCFLSGLPFVTRLEVISPLLTSKQVSKYNSFN